MPWINELKNLDEYIKLFQKLAELPQKMLGTTIELVSLENFHKLNIHLKLKQTAL